MRIEVNVNTANILNRLGLGSDKDAQKHLAETVERLCRPYVPMSAGSAAHMVNQAQVTADSIIYPGSYAHYQYYGEAMAGRAPKRYTGKALNYHGAPMRGKQWDKRMMADRGTQVEADLKEYFRRRG